MAGASAAATTVAAIIIKFPGCGVGTDFLRPCGEEEEAVGGACHGDQRRMFFQDGLVGSAWGDWASYRASALRAWTA